MAVEIPAGFSSIAFRFIGIVSRFFRSKLERHYWGYLILRRLKLASQKDDFNSVYITTIYNLIQNNGKPRDIIRLFEIQEVKESFEKELYEKNNWSFEIALDDHLHTNPNFRYLKKIDVNIQSEILDFKTEFRKIVNSTRPPKEIETFQVISNIEHSVASLQSAVEKINKNFGNLEIEDNTPFSISEAFPLVTHLSERGDAIKKLTEILTVKSSILLIGSIGTGKSQLAALFYEKHATGKIWISLRDTESENFPAKVTNALSERTGDKISSVNPQPAIKSIIEKAQDGLLIVLDDLPKLARDVASNLFLADLLKSRAKKKAKLLITSNYELPSQLRDVVSDDHFEYLPMPFLNEDETKEILLSYGATEEQAENFKIIVHGVSNGHPTIVSAISKFLKQHDWDITSEKINHLFQNDYSSDLTAEIYNSILTTIEDQYTRELLYRLNVVNGSFTSTQVKIVAEIDPEITNPQERFASVIGLWIQKSATSTYELSPLIKSLKTDNLNSIVARKINYLLAAEILSKKKLSQFEARKAINYFISAEAFDQAGFVLIIVLNEALKTPDLFFNWGFSLYWTYEKLPSQMNVSTRLYIRQLQLMLLIKKEKNTAFLRDDFEATVLEARSKNTNIASAALFLSMLYSKHDAAKSLEFFLVGMQTIDDLPEHESFRKQLEKNFVPEQLIWTSTRVVKTEKEIDSWFDAFVQLSPEQQAIAKTSEASDWGSAFMTGNLLGEEEKKLGSDQDWKKVLVVLHKISEKSKTLVIDLLFARSIKASILVLSEKLERVDEAKLIADDAILLLNKKNSAAEFIIKDTIGRQLFYKGKNAEAMPYVADAVLIEVAPTYTEKLNTFIVMSQLLGSKDNNSAHHYIEKALVYVNSKEDFSVFLKARVRAEYAISLATLGNVKDAIYQMEIGYSNLFDNRNESDDYKVLTLRYGHVLNYWHSIHYKHKQPDDIDGLPYEIPARGYFFLNYNSEFLKKHWFDERPFIMTHILLGCFEDIGDASLAKKWALNSATINKALTGNAFGYILLHAVPYYVLENSFDEAINCQVLLLKSYNSFEQSVESVKNERLKSMFQNRPQKKHVSELDEYIIAAAIIPITMRTLTLLLEEGQDSKAIVRKAIVAFERWEETFTNKESIREIIQIFRALDTVSVDTVNLLAHVQAYSGSNNDHVKTIGYLVASLYSNTTQAVQLHIAFIKTLDATMKTISMGLYKFIFIPFLESFWFIRHLKNPEDFRQSEFWSEKSLPYYEQGTLINKAKRLFKILCLHLNVSPSLALENWMEE